MNRRISVPLWVIPILLGAFLAGWFVNQPPAVARAQDGKAPNAVPPITKDMNANYVDGLHASKTVKPGRLFPLDSSGKFPVQVIPQGGGSTLDADTIDGIDSATFARKSDVLPIVFAGDGPGSGMNADYLDGWDSSNLTKGYSGTQIQGTVGVGANQYWFTFGYSTSQLVVWQVVPTTNGGKVKLDVETELGNGTLTYYLRVTNVGGVATNYNLVRHTFYQ